VQGRTTTTKLIPSEVIKKKRDGGTLSEDEIATFIQAFTAGEIPDYQMSALLMAIFFRGMKESETLALTKSMLHSGVVIDFSDISAVKVDKHSTGGVGDKTSLILGPIVAACGLKVPMISGRGLGHTGGTLDKLESIPGFNTQLTIEQFKSAVHQYGIAFIGQTKEICPADKKIYALRDVTATVESLPLICASIMSKKLAEGIDALVLDVKFGSGAFMKKPEDAERLAQELMSIARGYGKKVAALLTNMDQPLGQFAGNSLEVEECVQILQGKNSPRYYDTKELSLQLAAKMLHLGGAAQTMDAALSLATKTLDSGKAYEKFLELCKLHGGDLSKLPKPKHKYDVRATASGYVHGFNTESIGVVGIQIRAGRALTSDVIEPTAGIEFHTRIGQKIQQGDVLFTLHGADLGLLEAASGQLLSSVQLGDDACQAPSLIWKEIS
jgi:pyrimidine-nucleoside phosphorylase